MITAVRGRRRVPPAGATAVARLGDRLLDLPGWAVLLAALPLAALVSYAKLTAGRGSLASVVSSTGEALSFVIGGLLLRQRIPHNRMWCLTVVVGFAFLLEDLQFVPVRPVWGIGLVLASISFPATLWLALAFPTGTLTGRTDRVLVCFAVLGMGVLTCPGRTVVLNGSFVRLPWTPFTDRVRGVAHLLVFINLVWVVIRLLHRWARAASPHRRMFLVLATGWVSLLVVPELFDSLRDAGHDLSYPPLRFDRLPSTTSLLLVIVPVFSVVAGTLLLRAPRVDVDERIRALGERVTPAGLRDALADLLQDPALQLFVWGGDGFVDEQGRPVPEPVPSRGRAVSILGPLDEPLGALMHHCALNDDPQLHAAARRACSQALQIRHLHESAAEARRAVYAAADDARRQLERDLHDGAQQRLVALSLSLGELRARLDPAGDAEIEDAIGRVTDELRSAIADLRRLAAGTFPAALAQAGLRTAVEDLVDRTPLQVTVNGEPGQDLDELTQSTAYFVACEGIANALKHAAATTLTITFTRTAAELRVQVADNGVGGARITGRGLSGLTERARSLGGALTVASSDGGGTTLDLRLPLVGTRPDAAGGVSDDPAVALAGPAVPASSH